MKRTTIILIAVVAVLAILGFQGCSQYNGMVTADEDVKNAWAQVENQYQRRMDLIPNLVSTVKGYAEHEKTTFENVAQARSGLTSSMESASAYTVSGDQRPTEQQIQRFQDTQRQLQSALSLYVNAVREAYPELKANESFNNLMAQLEGTENRITTERKRYNDIARDYNIRIRKFPASIFAGMFGFSKANLFEADAEARKAPKVEF